MALLQSLAECFKGQAEHQTAALRDLLYMVGQEGANPIQHSTCAVVHAACTTAQVLYMLLYML